jgi:hypothetical protein
MTLDEALLILNDRLGREVTVWIEIAHDSPLLMATGTLEPWSPPAEEAGALLEQPPTHFDLFGNYSVGDARIDLSEAPVESVGTRPTGLTFRLDENVRLIVDW